MVFRRLGREVKDFSSLKSVMDTLAEIRDTESWIEYDFNSILQRYDILEQYLPSGVMSKVMPLRRSVASALLSFFVQTSLTTRCG